MPFLASIPYNPHIPDPIAKALVDAYDEFSHVLEKNYHIEYFPILSYKNGQYFLDLTQIDALHEAWEELPDADGDEIEKKYFELIFKFKRSPCRNSKTS